LLISAGALDPAHFRIDPRQAVFDERRLRGRAARSHRRA
jgi:hypothetical protein